MQRRGAKYLSRHTMVDHRQASIPRDVRERAYGSQAIWAKLLLSLLSIANPLFPVKYRTFHPSHDTCTGSGSNPGSDIAMNAKATSAHACTNQSELNATSPAVIRFRAVLTAAMKRIRWSLYMSTPEFLVSFVSLPSLSEATSTSITASSSCSGYSKGVARVTGAADVAILESCRGHVDVY